MGGVRRFSLLVVVVSVAVFATPWARAGGSGGSPVALVTAETANEVLAVSLGVHGGRILRRVHLHDPVTVAAAECGPAIAVSPSGTVTLLARESLRPLRVFHSFRSPQLASIVPGNGNLMYVTDAATGDLSVVDLVRRRVVDRVFVGFGAHHLAVSPAGSKAWVALSETASTIVRLDISDPR
jgi:DNA-binding beta-propeller fold protein YncE